ncbi:amino acid/polyamine/organocation transporter (APC superfamily) [Yimella lutea]|uniref:Amino acid/polyamine/organocation transporter (APC superfamily) n=1 Tax=Yimella lutea TaxID=587872 RepID=A0A542EHE8_9MICO|nr:APC family permease [Yimella lutea]TQJ14762.1 amino acid/polyamine/organocation transporter (APC superfamily) [Yimella lutea]
MTASAPLARRLGTADAVVVGLSAMLGAGVFSAYAPAAASAGSLLLVALAIAAFVAFCNAVASAQLAAAYPSSGGTYLFGREVLGPWWGFVAGWGFVIGKTASCAAMAMTFAYYLFPDTSVLQRLSAAVAVVALTALNLRGITRTVVAAKVLVTITVLVLVFFVVLVGTRESVVPNAALASAEPYGVLQAAGLLFFAFAGYARIATLAEEVRRPEMIGRAILIAFSVAVTLYAVIGVVSVKVLGSSLAAADAPLMSAVDAVGASWAGPIVRCGAVAASLGALLALIAGVSRTMLAMARERDLPSPFATVDERHQVPAAAQIAVGVVVVLLVLLADLRGAIGFSSFGVLTYYFVTNASAFRQPCGQRRWPRAFNILGMAGCAVLVATLPWQAVALGALVLAGGVLGRAALRRP